MISDTQFHDLVASLPTTIAATAAAIASLVGMWQSIKNGKKQDVVAAKQDILVETAEKIHTLTNSTLSEVTRSRDVGAEKILGLQKVVAALRETLAAKGITPPADATTTQQQVNRIEQTGEDTNSRVQQVENKVDELKKKE